MEICDLFSFSPSMEETRYLAHPITQEEVLSVLKEMTHGRIPCLNDSTMELFINFQDTMII